MDKSKSVSSVPVDSTARCSTSHSIVCIDLDDSDTVEPATTGSGTSGALDTKNASPSCPTASAASTSQPTYPSYLTLPPRPIRPAPVFIPPRDIHPTVPIELLVGPVQKYRPPIRPPFYQNVYPGPQRNNPDYSHMFNPQMPSYNPAPPELRAHTVAEELRSLMATIQQSSSYSNYS